jgi:hypothetical protein
MSPDHSRSIFGDCLSNILSGNGDHRGAKPLREAESLGDPIAFGLACPCAGRRTSGSGGSHVGTACVRSSGKSRKRCNDEQTGLSRKQGNGLLKSSLAILPIMPCRPMAWRWPRFDITSNIFGIGSYVGVAREQEWYGRGWRNWSKGFSRSRRFFIRGPACGSPLYTQGRSRVPELGSLGSVRGALRNERPYRECGKSRQWDSIAACAALESDMTHISGFERSQLQLMIGASAVVEVKHGDTCS